MGLDQTECKDGVVMGENHAAENTVGQTEETAVEDRAQNDTDQEAAGQRQQQMHEGAP